VDSVVAKEFFDCGELAGRRLLDLLLAICLLLFVGLLMNGDLYLRTHKTKLSGLFKKLGKSFTGAVQFATNGIGRLFSKRSDLFVAHLFVRH